MRHVWKVSSTFTPSQRRSGKISDLQEPQHIDSFTHDAERKLHRDDRGRRIYCDPPKGADLYFGLVDAVWREDKNEHLDSLLYTLKAGDHGEKLRKADVVGFCAKITRLCTVVYQTREFFASPWAMNVMLLGSTLYIEDHSTAQSRREQANRQENSIQQSPTYCGFAFERFCFKPEISHLQPHWPPGWSGNVNTNEQWVQVVERRLRNYKVILAGEIDCVDSTGAAVELKTSFSFRPGKWDNVNFEWKMLNTYMRAFLLGVPKVVVGFRDRRGILEKVRTFNTLDLPALAQGKPHHWNPKLGLHSGARLLTWIRETTMQQQTEEQSSEPAVWRLELQAPFEEVSLRRIDADEVRREVQDSLEEGRVGFLPRDFYEWAMNDFPSPSSSQAPIPSHTER